MKLHKVKITTPGHFIIFKDKKTRTPVEFKNVTDEDLLLLKNQIRQQNLKYYLDDNSDADLSNKKLDEKKVNIEELYNEDEGNKSILKKLLEV